jgi:hypothetical protein
MSIFHRFSVALLLLTSVGCNSGYTVTGRVTFEEDGSPLTIGIINFENEKYRFSGQLNADGNYLLEGASPREGVPAGVYGVSVSGAVKSTTDEIARTMVNENLVTKKFFRPETSDLICEVNGKMTFDFQVAKPTAEERSRMAPPISAPRVSQPALPPLPVPLRSAIKTL